MTLMYAPIIEDGDRGQLSGFILIFFFVLLATILFLLMGVV